MDIIDQIRRRIINVLEAAEDACRCCQTNSKQSPFFADQQLLGDEKLPPFAKRGVSFLFEPDFGVNVPFEIESDCIPMN